jgi:hypothetical protein
MRYLALRVAPCIPRSFALTKLEPDIAGLAAADMPVQPLML